MDTPITDEELLNIAGNVPSADYHSLGIKLGHGLGRLEEILDSKNNDYRRSTVAILMSWMAAASGESWRTRRSRLRAIFSSLGIKASNVLLPAPPYSSQPPVTVPERNRAIPIPAVGLTDSILKEIADNLETDEQMESLARALGRNRGQINQCHTTNRMTGSVTTRGTVDLLTAWKATVQPENQMSSMHSAMTSARLLNLRDTVLLIAMKKQEQEQKDYRRKLDQQKQHQAESSSQDNLSSMNNSETDAAFSILRSVDPRTNSSLRWNDDARRTVESQQRSTPPYQASDSSTSGSFQGQPKFYDIYLKFSQETVHVHKVKDIIRRNGWTMMTANDCRLGVPKMTSIEDALKTCSHVVLILTKEDCEKNDPYQTMTMGMAFQSTVGGSLNGRVISIRCCEERHLPSPLQSLENACINDPYLEDKLKRTIDVSISKGKKGSTVGTSSTLPTEGSIAPLVTSDLGTQPLTAAQVASEVERMLPQINDLPAGPSSSVNIHGNVFNMYVTGRHDLVPPHPMIIPLAVRHELSKLLNGPRVTHDDWTGLASELRLDDYIASLTRKPDPTSDLIDLAEKQKKICSLEDLRHILKQMKRDDCVDVLDARASVVESNNRLMIQDRDRNSSSSDDF
eukprot:XP_003730789.1 PREDICTED: uncharacterized protein LOC100891602 [Strongylocentrotus purpuratus]